MVCRIVLSSEFDWDWRTEARMMIDLAMLTVELVYKKLPVMDYRDWLSKHKMSHEGRGRPKGIDIGTRDKIIDALAGGPKRFNQLKEITGINPGVLKKHLEWLRKDRAVRRKVLPIKGHHVEYSMVGWPYTGRERVLASLDIAGPTSDDALDEIVRPYERHRILSPERKESYVKKYEAIKKAFADVDEDLRIFEWHHMKPFHKQGLVFFDEVYRAINKGIAFYKRKMETEEFSSDREVSEQMLANKMMIDDVASGHVCMECFGKGDYSLMILEPETRIASCPKCGCSTEMIADRISEEGEKIERKQASYGKVLKTLPAREERLGSILSKEEIAVLKMLNRCLREEKKEES